MKKIYLLFFILAVSGLQVFAQTNFKQNKTNGFIENKGQLKDQDGNTNTITKYLLNINGLKVQLRNNGFSYDTYTTEKTENTLANVKNEGFNFFQNNTPEEAISKFHRVDIDFLNINPNPQIIAENLIENNINYFISATPQTGIKDVKMFGKITYKNIYPNIDLEFVAGSNKEKPVEYNFIVYPGADASKIKWTYTGSDEISLVNEQIHIKTSNGILTENIPLTYEKETQKIGKAKYQLNKDGSFGFEIENYNKNKTLIIDPVPFIDWCTYYGGENFDALYAIITDDSGYVYVTGMTDSKNSIATIGAYQTKLKGDYDVMLAKFTGSGKRIWCTYFGGSGYEAAGNILIDKNRNLYISGGTNSSYGIADSAAFKSKYTYNPLDIEYNDVFIAMFDNDGQWKWGTYFGGEGDDVGGYIVKDENGNIYVAGGTNSKTNIAFGNSHQDTIGSKNSDGFLVKFDDSCRRVIWSTYYGGKGTDAFYSINYKNNNLYLVGPSNSSSNIATSGTYKSVNTSDGKQGFFVCFDTSGSRKWGSYYGGLSADYLLNICVDDTGNIYLYGVSESKESIATVGSHQFQNGGAQDCFLVKMNSSFKRIWGTYFGGIGHDGQGKMYMNENGDMYIATSTRSYQSTSTMTSPGSPKPIGDPTQWEAVVAKFSNDGILKWGTYCGTDNYYDEATSITLDKFGNIYVLGSTQSVTKFATSGVQQEKFNGISDAFILRLSENCNNYEIEGQKIQDITCKGLEDGKATVKLISALPIQKYVWSNGATSEIIEGLSTGWYKFVATDSRGCSRTDSVLISDAVQLSIGKITGENKAKKLSTEIYSVSSQNNVNYNWEITNGTIQNGQGTNSVEVLWGNDFTGKVKVVIYKYINCGDSTTLDVALENYAGINTWNAQKGIQLYPNPASESVMISLEDEKLLNSNFEISDNTGRVIQKGIFNHINTKIDVSGFAAGMYFLSAENYKIKIIITN